MSENIYSLEELILGGLVPHTEIIDDQGETVYGVEDTMDSIFVKVEKISHILSPYDFENHHYALIFSLIQLNAILEIDINCGALLGWLNELDQLTPINIEAVRKVDACPMQKFDKIIQYAKELKALQFSSFQLQNRGKFISQTPADLQ